MLRFSLLTFLFLLIQATSSQGAFVLWSDDYETGSHYGYFGTTLGGAVVDNPSKLGINLSNKVLQVNDLTNTSPWGELRANNGTAGSFALANYEAIPGVDTFTFSFDYFIPQNTVSASNDGLTLIVRFSATANGSPYSAINSAGVNTTTATRGVWQTLTLSGKISSDYDTATTGNQVPLFITPIIALSDAPTSGANGDNLAGTWVYYDNVRFMVTPEPSPVALSGLGLALLFLRRKRL